MWRLLILHVQLFWPRWRFSTSLVVDKLRTGVFDLSMSIVVPIDYISICACRTNDQEGSQLKVGTIRLLSKVVLSERAVLIREWLLKE